MPGKKPTKAQQAARAKASKQTLWFLARQGNRKAKQALAKEATK